MLVFASRMLIGIVTKMIFGQPCFYGLFFYYSSPLVICEAIFLLEYFSNLQIKSNNLTKWIFSISLTTFGVYLFHNTYSFKTIIWGNLLYKIPSPTLQLICGILLTFVLGVILDYIRVGLFKIIKINDFCEKIALKIDLIISKILRL